MSTRSGRAFSRNTGRRNRVNLRTNVPELCDVGCITEFVPASETLHSASVSTISSDVQHFVSEQVQNVRGEILRDISDLQVQNVRDEILRDISDLQVQNVRDEILRDISDLLRNSETRHSSIQRQQMMPSQTTTSVSTSLSNEGKETKPNTFDGRADWDAYLCQFELVAQKNCWSDTAKVVELGAALIGPALTTLKEVTSPITYPNLVAALDARYGTKNQTELHMALLHSRTQRDTESVTEYHQEMKEMGSKAWPSTSREKSVEELLTFRFIHGLRDPGLKEKLFTAWPRLMQEALTIALRLEAVGTLMSNVHSQVQLRAMQVINKEHKTVVCWRCDQPGHVLKDCPTWRKGRHFQEREEMSTKRQMSAENETRPN